MALTIPSDGRVFWTGTAAAIPANWSADAAFNNRYLQGSSTAGSNGGFVGHTHAVTHTHIQGSHFHSLSVTGASSGTNVSIADRSGLDWALDGHTHPNISSVATTAVNQSTSPGGGSASPQPPFIQCIVLQPDDGLQDVPSNGIVLTDSASLESGYVVAVDLDGRFIKGTTGDGGGTGGSATHSHTYAGHTHIQDPHSHADSPFGTTTSTFIKQLEVTIGAVWAQHHQATSIGNATPTNTSTVWSSNTASNEPLYHTLLAIQNKTGGQKTQNRIIIPYMGSSGSIPAPWILCDGTQGTPNLVSRQVKCTASIHKIGDIGGKNSHAHTMQSHNHTQTAAHTHTYVFTTNTGRLALVLKGIAAAADTHTHTSNAMGNATPVNTAVSGTSATNDVRWLYRTVLWIARRNTTVWIKGGNIKGGSIAA